MRRGVSEDIVGGALNKHSHWRHSGVLSQGLLEGERGHVPVEITACASI